MKNFTSRIAVAAIAATGITSASASGLALVEQSAKQVGSAIAGGAAAADDATTVYFNPAGMSRLDHTQFALSGHTVAPSFKFSGAATTSDQLPIGGGAVIAGGNGGDAATTSVIPNFYWVRPLDSSVRFGLGVNAPFGLTTEYSPNWAGRYQAIKSQLQTLDLNPSLSFKLNDRLSLGAGLDALYANADLTNAVDYSATCLSVAGAACLGLNLASPGNPATDGRVRIKGNGWGYGYNLGLLYEPTYRTRIGLAYRSMIKEELSGTANFAAPANATLPPTLAAALADTGASVSLHLPESASLSMVQQLDPRWNLMADLTWTAWSRFDELAIQLVNPYGAGTNQPEHWNNTYKLSVGFDYRAGPKWTWRGGIAYDQSPIPSTALRTPRIPDNNRKWLAAGFTYRQSPRLSVDVALAHLFLKSTPIDAVDVTFGDRLAGNYASSVNTLSAQVNWTF